MIRHIPWLTEKAIEFLDGLLKDRPDATVLEFGCGGSTIWMAQRIKNLTSIEHDGEWFNIVSNYLSGHNECQRVDIQRMELPYHSILNDLPDEHFDLVVVDGRGRVECVKAAMRTVKIGGFILLDNTERGYYSGAFKLLCLWDMERSEQVGPDSVGFNHAGWETCWWKKPNK